MAAATGRQNWPEPVTRDQFVTGRLLVLVDPLLVDLLLFFLNSRSTMVIATFAVEHFQPSKDHPTVQANQAMLLPLLRQRPK